MVIYTIKLPEKISLNRIYAGIHHRVRSAVKEDYHYAVMEAKPKKYQGSYPIEMHYHFKVGGKPLDITNHAFMVKMIEDGLVERGTIAGDEPHFVSKVSITSERAKKGQEDIVVVTIHQPTL